MKAAVGFVIAFGAWSACAAPAVPSPDSVRENEAIQRVLAGWDQDEHADLKAVVVRLNGQLVAERYYNRERPQTLHDIRSAGKSITALLVGAAIDRGKIRSLGDPLSAYLPAAQERPIGVATIEQLLSMRSGLDANDEEPGSPGNEDRLDESADPLAYALAIPLRDPPGSRYVYNSLTSYLVGVMLEQVAGRRMGDFARDVLFEPMGIGEWRWDADVTGHTKGQGNLFLTARDFATIGQMVLDGGVYQGRRILSEAWISQMLTPRVDIAAVDPYADQYGYFWYTKTHVIGTQRVPVYFASGNGGNKIYLVPSRALVVAIASSAYGRGYGQRRSAAILKALLSMP